MIQELGRKPSQEKVPLFFRKNSQSSDYRRSESPEKRLSEERSSVSAERETDNGSLLAASKQFVKGMGERYSVDVTADFLNTIEDLYESHV